MAQLSLKHSEKQRDTQESPKPGANSTAAGRRALLIAVMALIAFGALSYWGGLPRESEMPKFIIGMVVLVVVGGGIAALGWFLLFRPLPASALPATQKSTMSVGARLFWGAALAITLVMQSVGGAWDEIWHNKFGIPFGEDFFWRPHILIYISFIVVIFAAGFAWYALIMRGKGSLVSRFRADPLVGMLVLVGVVFVYALPADPIWHAIYGEDLSAFSVPHVLLTILNIFAFVVASGLVLSAVPVRVWRGIWRLTVANLVPLIVFTSILVTTNILLTVDWFMLSASDFAARRSAAFQRPDWLLPVFITFCAVLTGTLAVYSLRRYGAATLIGVLAVGFRLAMVNVLDHSLKSADAWLVCLPSLVMIDVVAFLHARMRGDVRSPAWWMVGGGAALGVVAVSLPLINQWFVWPRITLENLPVVALAVTATALVMAWIGQLVGDYLALHNKLPNVMAIAHDKPGSEAARLRFIVPAMLVVAVAFTVWFILTAAPPA